MPFPVALILLIIYGSDTTKNITGACLGVLSQMHKISNFFVIETIAVTPAKFCRMMKTTKYSSWVDPKYIQEGRQLPS